MSTQLEQIDFSLDKRAVERLLSILKDVPEGVKFSSAKSAADLEEAFNLRYRRYINEGLMGENQTGLYLSLYLFLPQSKTFLARQNGKLAATVSFVRDNEFGLSIDEYFKEEMDSLRHQKCSLHTPSILMDRKQRHFWGAQEPHAHGIFPEFLTLNDSYISEVTAFAAETGTQRKIAFHLMNFMNKESLRNQVNHVTIKVQPSDAPVYETFWGFRRIGSKVCKKNNRDLVSLANNMHCLTQSFKSCKINGYASPLIGFWDYETEALETRYMPDNETLRYFLKERTSVWQKTPEDMKELFIRCHEKAGNKISLD